MTRLAGKRAAVTGASSGIGQAVARALAGEGAAVVAWARRFAATALTERPEPGQIAEVALDVTDEAAVKARMAEAGDLDVLVCSAGVGSFAPVHTASAADLRAMLEVHVTGTFLCAREAVRTMRARRTGHIIAIGSVAAGRAFTDCAGYTAAKAGQLGLMRVLAEEARPYDLRVTTVMPGATDTPIWDDRPGFDRSKMMKPDDVAALIVELVVRPQVAVDELVIMPPGGAL